MISSRIVRRLSDSCAVGVAAAVLLTASPYLAYADSIMIGRSSGATEEYSGTILSATDKSVLFLVECAGEPKEFAWKSQVQSIVFNGRCTPEPLPAIGGSNPHCWNPFWIFHEASSTSVFASKFDYDGSVLTIAGAGQIDVKRNRATFRGKDNPNQLDFEGTMIALSKEPEKNRCADGRPAF